MKRRQFLAAGASTAALLSAGCLGDGDSDQTDTPGETTATDTPGSTDGTDTPGTTTETDTGDLDGQTVSISGDDDYKSFEVSEDDYSGDLSDDGEFVLEWTAQNELSGDFDFDVYLLSAAEYSAYQDAVGGSGDGFDYIHDGTSQKITTSDSRTVTLSGGQSYYVVIDNTNIGPAEDPGPEETREVTIKIETSQP